jgi:hypothetical protein
MDVEKSRLGMVGTRVAYLMTSLEDGRDPRCQPMERLSRFRNLLTRLRMPRPAANQNCLSSGFGYPAYLAELPGPGRHLQSFLDNADIQRPR